MQDQLASNQELIEAFRTSSGKPDKPFTALDLLLLTCAGNLGYLSFAQISDRVLPQERTLSKEQ